MLNYLRSAALVMLVLCLPSCATNPPPTPVASVADSATKVEQSANVILHAAQTANATVVPSTGKPVISRDALDQVAIQVNKLGRLGTTLKSALDSYNAAKKAGADLTQQRLAVQQIVGEIASGINVVSGAVPPGTVSAIDNAVAAILSVLVDVRTQAGLPASQPLDALAAAYGL
jgi:hypothetical protein